MPSADAPDLGAERAQKTHPAIASGGADPECNKIGVHMFHWINKADLDGLLQTRSELKPSWLHLVQKSKCNSGSQLCVIQTRCIDYVFSCDRGPGDT